MRAPCNAPIVRYRRKSRISLDLVDAPGERLSGYSSIRGSKHLYSLLCPYRCLILSHQFDICLLLTVSPDNLARKEPAASGTPDRTRRMGAYSVVCVNRSPEESFERQGASARMRRQPVLRAQPTVFSPSSFSRSQHGSFHEGVRFFRRYMFASLDARLPVLFQIFFEIPDRSIDKAGSRIRAFAQTRSKQLKSRRRATTKFRATGFPIRCSSSMGGFCILFRALRDGWNPDQREGTTKISVPCAPGWLESRLTGGHDKDFCSVHSRMVSRPGRQGRKAWDHGGGISEMVRRKVNWSRGNKKTGE